MSFPIKLAHHLGRCAFRFLRHQKRKTTCGMYREIRELSWGNTRLICNKNRPCAYRNSEAQGLFFIFQKTSLCPFEGSENILLRPVTRKQSLGHFLDGSLWWSECMGSNTLLRRKDHGQIKALVSYAMNNHSFAEEFNIIISKGTSSALE